MLGTHAPAGAHVPHAPVVTLDFLLAAATVIGALLVAACALVEAPGWRLLDRAERTVTSSMVLLRRLYSGCVNDSSRARGGARGDRRRARAHLSGVSHSGVRVGKEAMSPPVPHTGKPSDQMPEEAPAEQVPDDVPGAPEGAAREAARRHAKDARRHGSERDRAGEKAADDKSRTTSARTEKATTSAAARPTQMVSRSKWGCRWLVCRTRSM